MEGEHLISKGFATLHGGLPAHLSTDSPWILCTWDSTKMFLMVCKIPEKET